MASTSDIQTVRLQTGESADTPPYTDDYVGELIDASGVTGATVTIYQQLLAKYAKLVDTSEAGASHKFSDLYKNAKAQLESYQAILAAEAGTVEHVKVKKAVRSS